MTGIKSICEVVITLHNKCQLLKKQTKYLTLNYKLIKVFVNTLLILRYNYIDYT